MPVLCLFARVLVCFAFTSAAWALEAKSGVTATPLLKTQTSWDGQPLAYPAGKAEITGLKVEIAPGAETGWHTHPVPSFGVVLEGELEITLKDGRIQKLKAGEAIAEVVNTLHNGRNSGKTPTKLLVFYAGAQGMAITHKADAHP